MKGQSSQKRSTFRRFPASSFSASSPPGPMLLLRFFLGPAFVSAIDDTVAILPIVMFSFSMSMAEEGRCAIDVRAPGRVCTALGDCVVAMVSLLQRAMWLNSILFSFTKNSIHVWPLRRKNHHPLRRALEPRVDNIQNWRVNKGSTLRLI